MGSRPPKPRSRAKDAALQFAAGGTAGLVEVCIMHPLDLVKTRFQIQRGADDPTRYKSLMDCFRQMVKKEGPLSFYKGILPPIFAEMPKRATKFFCFEQYKLLFSHPGLSQPVTFAMAGFCSGMTEAVIICPFEMVKITLQAERVAFAKRSSTWATARRILRSGGFGGEGIYRGFAATLMRNGVWNGVYFGLYHTIKLKMPPPEDTSASFMYRFLLGFTSGFLACVANIPFDVAKSRIQGPQPVPGIRKYDGTLRTLRMVYAEEGFTALYKGFVPKVMRLAPGGAIMFLVYDAAYDFLKSHF